MTGHQEFSKLIRKIKCGNSYAQGTALKDIALSIQDANKSDLQGLLELLISTHDTDIQNKVYCVLTAYILNNGTNYEVIVKCSPVYATIQNSLFQQLPMKAASALNFVIALLSCGDGNDPSLLLYIRNMIRVSGCLNTMCQIFCGSMMYQDTWIALCQCIAESCRDSEVNQNYCSYLVPLCVQRCRQSNAEVCSILQSLLHNNERNLKLFIDNGGLTIFTRQLLQYNLAIQLLNTVVEKSSVAASLLIGTDVLHHLQDFINLYGPLSQIGRWSTIILYHLNKKGNGSVETSQKQTIETFRKEYSRKASLYDDSLKTINDNGNKLNDNIANDAFVNKEDHPRLLDFSRCKQNNFANEDRNEPAVDDTAKLFQNVIKEIYNWKSREHFVSKKSFNFDSKFDNRNKAAPFKKRPQNCSVMNRRNTVNKSHNDLSFSFLLTETLQNPNMQYDVTCNDILAESVLASKNTTCFKFTAKLKDKEVQTDNSVLSSTSYNNASRMDLKHFRPPCNSTPKHHKTYKFHTSNIATRNRASIRASSSSSLSRKQISSVTSNKQDTKRTKYTNNTKHHEKSPLAREEVQKQRSMSARIFSIINESCTTIVKGMKSIFKTKPNKSEQQNDNNAENKNEIVNSSCSYSFTNYMRKRDAFLKELSLNEDTSSVNYKVNSCKTCKDTIILQQKLTYNDHLKQTVRKLKTGINLYGCDFKKIAQKMWPRDRFMTPAMLYKLYRKLIVKDHHGNHEFWLKSLNAPSRK